MKRMSFIFLVCLFIFEQVEGNRLYYVAAFGDAVCLDATTGKKIWQVNIQKEYNGPEIKWGYTESPLIYNEKIFLTPGGPKNNFIALNKNNGKKLWSLDLDSTVNSFCSPVLINLHGKDLVLLNTSLYILLIDPNTGVVVVKHPLTDSLELLRDRNSFICRVRSKDGAEGIYVGNPIHSRHGYPMLHTCLYNHFIGKDARDLDLLVFNAAELNVKRRGVPLCIIYMLHLTSILPNAAEYHEFKMFENKDANGTIIPIVSKTEPLKT